MRSLTTLLLFAGASSWSVLVMLLLAPSIWNAIPLHWLHLGMGHVHWVLPSTSPSCRWAERCSSCLACAMQCAEQLPG